MKKKGLLAVMLGIVLAFGFVAVACADSGGNINIVKNGVFKNVDASITVGKALENNSTLKGGKWAELEKDGRNYVTYTVKFTPTQIKGFSGKGQQPNLKNAETFFDKLKTWRGNRSFLSELTTMTAEEVSKACDIFSATLSKRNKEPLLKDFFYPFIEVDKGVLLKEEYYGQWFRANKGNIPDKWTGELISEDSLIREYSDVVSLAYSQYSFFWHYRNMEDLQNGKIIYGDYFHIQQMIEEGSEIDIKLQKDIADSMIRLYSETEQAEAQLKIALDEYRQMRAKDIEPLFTINGFEITVSFLMNIDGTFVPNAVESFAEITMNCLDNLKVRFRAGYTTGNSAVLTMVYRSFTPKVI